MRLRAKRQADVAQFKQTMEHAYDIGRKHGLYGRPKALGTFSWHYDMAYTAGWHDGNDKRRSIAARLRSDADLTSAVDEMIAEVQS